MLRQSASLLMIYLKGQWGKVTVLIVLLVGSISLELIAPQWLGRFVDDATAGAALSTLQLSAVVFVLLTVVRQVFVAVAGYVGEDVSWAATNRLRIDLTRHCLELDMSFQHEYPPGVLVERIDGDVSTLSEFFSTFVFNVIGRVLLSAGIIVLTFVVDWRVGALLLCFAVMVTVVLRRLQGISIPHLRALRQTKSDLSGFLEEQLVSTEDVRANGARPYVMWRLSRHLDELVRRTRSSRVASRVFSSALEVSVAIAGAAVLGFGAVLLQRGTMTIGGIYLAFYYTALLAQSLTSLTFQIDQLQSAFAGMQRISALYYRVGAVPDTGTERVADGPFDVVFDRVRFGYNRERDVLRDVSFRLPAGESLGLLGRTGSGKTSIARLLCRFYDVSGGAARLGGIDVRELALGPLRSRIGVITQDVELFHASIRDNLTLFSDEIADEAIVDAFRRLGLHEWYTNLADGLDTVISGDGRSMSAGEAQLLAFVRVFLHDPDLLILDEASSRIDAGTERLIEKAIDRLLAGRTAIVIAHRLSTVAKVDHILILQDGAVQETGARETLLNTTDSRFAAMLAEARA
ncbi:helicase [Virgisporangium aliadipatigenens]|uniref:Helicase n=1 Tax=Virgisporangium aliadipatigenens TaxID=741659 RepID=A0A8J3YH06_9ACTN|nr:ABC transporter ATP-binding protein [Virgisporangium aliadipatigenens]GIJ44252.1 helicase [Virgisporangium aliadipatigenens]